MCDRTSLCCIGRLISGGRPADIMPGVLEVPLLLQGPCRSKTCITISGWEKTKQSEGWKGNHFYPEQPEKVNINTRLAPSDGLPTKYLHSTYNWTIKESLVVS